MGLLAGEASIVERVKRPNCHRPEFRPRYRTLRHQVSILILPSCILLKYNFVNHLIQRIQLAIFPSNRLLNPGQRPGREQEIRNKQAEDEHGGLGPQDA
jgi:hypothetical protein